MNHDKLNAALFPWRTAHKKKKAARTNTEAFWASRDIAKALPGMVEAYATPETVRAESAPSPEPSKAKARRVKAEPEDDEDTTTRKCFDYYCIPATPAMLALVEAVWLKWSTQQALFSRRIEPQDKFLLSVCLANLVNAELTDPSIEGVTVTRDKFRLSLLSRYRPQVFNRRFLVVVDGLVRCGCLHQVKGRAWHGNSRPKKGFLTILHSTLTLQNLMREHSVTDVRDTKWERSGQEIILRKTDRDSGLEEYSDLDVLANGYRAEVRLINEMLCHGNISVLNRPGLPFVDDRDRFLQRQFTYHSWTSGGRLLGGFWIPMSKKDRHERILLNGEVTAELDYNSLPYHCMYAQAKAIKPAGDVYAIPGLDPESRDGIKKLMLSLTFDKKSNRNKFPKGSSVLFSLKDQKAGASVAIAKIRAHHASISHLLGADKGHGLQFIESQVLIAALLKVRQEGLIGLPIYDCLLVPVSQAERIKGIMEEVSLLVAGISCPVKLRQPTDL